MIDAEFVKAIAALVNQPRVPHSLFDFQGQSYRIEPDGKAVPIGVPVLVRDVLTLSTLDSLVTYLATNRDELNLSRVAIHVEGPGKVSLVDRVLAATGDRHPLAIVHLSSLFGNGATEFRFGQYLDTETFIIGLQTLFADRGQRAEVLKFCASVQDSKSVEAFDDGVAQSATVRSGVSLSITAKVPNPVALAPFRTFREIPQPVSPFVLRAKSSGEPNRPPTIALFECDGGAWRLAALSAIKEYLGDALQKESMLALEDAGGEHRAAALESIPVYA